MTNYKVIGAGYTPIRSISDRAADMIDKPSACLALVVTHDGTAGIYFGTPQEAWKSAAALSAQKHIVYVKKPYKRVLSVMPRLYDDIWTAGKGMYKMEPAVADGGEVVIFAPHIDEVSYTHGTLIEEIGYHCRDYFLAQWDRFKGYPGGILAHSAHVKGLGTFDAATKTESPRVQVTLATAIPQARCRHINLGYLDPAAIDRQEWEGREDEGVLVVPRAGEMLYRVKDDAERQ
jgi:lactate racemase